MVQGEGVDIVVQVRHVVKTLWITRVRHIVLGSNCDKEETAMSGLH